MSFTMVVKEIFNFQDGRVVFVGDVYDGPGYIKNCNCDLYVGNKFLRKINIEGEMIASGKQSSLRSLSSTEKIDTSSIPFRDVEVRIVCND
jgi:hypothetical protein